MGRPRHTPPTQTPRGSPPSSASRPVVRSCRISTVWPSEPRKDRQITARSSLSSMIRIRGICSRSLLGPSVMVRIARCKSPVGARSWIFLGSATRRSPVHRRRFRRGDILQEAPAQPAFRDRWTRPKVAGPARYQAPPAPPHIAKPLVDKRAADRAPRPCSGGASDRRSEAGRIERK